MTSAKQKAKYRKGQWVKFRKGLRHLSGCIQDVTFWRSGVTYDIGRNQQTFRCVYEENIEEVAKGG